MEIKGAIDRLKEQVQNGGVSGNFLMGTTNHKVALLIVLVGPSGVGKSTISRKLAERMHLKYIVSATTRKQAEKDDKGKAYDYIDEATFFKKLENGEFLEYAKVFDEYYGTPKRPHA